jgi:hypothetical protein
MTFPYKTHTLGIYSSSTHLLKRFKMLPNYLVLLQWITTVFLTVWNVFLDKVCQKLRKSNNSGNTTYTDQVRNVYDLFTTPISHGWPFTITVLAVLL